MLTSKTKPYVYSIGLNLALGVISWILVIAHIGHPISVKIAMVVGWLGTLSFLAACSMAGASGDQGLGYWGYIVVGHPIAWLINGMVFGWLYVFLRSRLTRR